MTTNLYRFGYGTADGDGSMKELLGGKGAGLAAMAKLGLPIPAGVTIPTSFCDKYQNDGEGAKGALCETLAAKVLMHLDSMIVASGKQSFLPLLSVRSGARVSMPGMMDTILNVGISDENLADWSKRIGERAALDSYRRLIQMYGGTVMGIEGALFEHELERARIKAGVETDAELSAKQLAEVVDRFKEVYSDGTGTKFPQKLAGQLAGCIGAVFASWNSERAIEYRIANKIPGDWGTAVTVQAMVFGNMNEKSATGVLFTRDPNTGEPGLFGEYLINAQGEDVVAGIRTPEPLAGMAKWSPSVYEDLQHWAFFMEAEGRDMQDMEFTVQNGTLFILQTRTGKRSARAAFKIAKDLADEGVITMDEAAKRVTAKQYMALKRPTIAAGFKTAPTVTGLPAAGAVVTGVAVLTAEDAKHSKVPCILVREETTPDDFGGMMASVGILTRTGGATSHAAVVARGMDKCCVVGASAMKIGVTVKAGDKVTLDGATGRVWINADVPVIPGQITAEAAAIAAYARAANSTAAAVRIELDPQGFEGQLPPEGKVVLGVAALVTDDKAGRRMRLLLEALEARPKLTGVIDFHPAAGTTHSDDVALMATLGLTSGPAAKAVAVNVTKVKQKLCAAGVPKKLMARWVVKTGGELLVAVTARGWGVASTAATLGDLIKAKGAVEVCPTLPARLEKEGVTMETLFALLAKAGSPVAVMPKPVDEDTLLFSVLGK